MEHNKNFSLFKKLFVDTLEEEYNRINNLKQEYKERTKKLFEETSQDIFKIIPELNTISWIQYAPYFNDGDPCIFSIHGEISFSKLTSEDVSSYQSDNEPDEEINNDVTKIFEKIIYLFDDDMLKEMFGEDSLVLIFRDGDNVVVDVQEYEHD